MQWLKEYVTDCANNCVNRHKNIRSTYQCMHFPNTLYIYLGGNSFRTQQGREKRVRKRNKDRSESGTNQRSGDTVLLPNVTVVSRYIRLKPDMISIQSWILQRQQNSDRVKAQWRGKTKKLPLHNNVYMVRVKTCVYINGSSDLKPRIIKMSGTFSIIAKD